MRLGLGLAVKQVDQMQMVMVIIWPGEEVNLINFTE